MTGWRASALLAALLLALPSAARAQDSTALLPPRLLQADTTRLAPLFRIYDIIVHRGDSAVSAGQRTVAMLPGSYAGVPAWRIIEARTGAVGGVDSLWLGTNARPLYWASAVGAGRLTAQFVDDTIYGMVAIGRVNRNVVLPVPPNTLAMTAMTDVLMALLPLHAAWSDSVQVLEIGPSSASVIPAELIVVARESFETGVGPPVPVWVLALRAPQRQMLYWIDQSTGVPLRIQQNLPSHIGSRVEYRLRVVPPVRLLPFWH